MAEQSTVNLQTLLNSSDISGSVALSTHTVLYLLSGENLTPIGLMRNFNVMQDPDIRRAFELGSKVPHLSSGIVMARFQVGHIVGVYFDGIKTFLDEISGTSGFDNTKAYDFVIMHFTKKVDGYYTPVSAYKIIHCVLSNYSISVMAGDTFVIENAVFEAAKVEEYPISQS